MRVMKTGRSMMLALAAVMLHTMLVQGADIPEGKYIARINGERYEFRGDGTVNYNGTEGSYRIKEDDLTVMAGGYAYRYTFEIIDDLLLLYGTEGRGIVLEMTDSEDDIQAIRYAAVGETVYYGSYERDNDQENGQEEIEWIVLDKKGDRALLLSKYGLDMREYNRAWTDVTWEESTLRGWLNSSFYYTAFTVQEAERIRESIVKAEDNKLYGTEAGSHTKDWVFLLNSSEVERYFPYIPDRQCYPTE